MANPNLTLYPTLTNLYPSLNPSLAHAIHLISSFPGLDGGDGPGLGDEELQDDAGFRNSPPPSART